MDLIDTKIKYFASDYSLVNALPSSKEVYRNYIF
jgi:hypothetical protein